MRKNRGQSSWISLSDLMTGLMLVFLIIVVIMQENIYSTLVRYENTKQQIYEALNNKFAIEQKNQKLTISQDLVVRFLDTEPLFEKDKAILSQRYKDVLDEFIPKYIEIMLDKKFINHIQEVRIGGHTAKRSAAHREYIDLVNLSQNRARAILQYLVSSESFRKLSDDERKDLRFKLMAIGFGDGRMVDVNGKFVQVSGGQPSGKSRRVEFRIMTDAERRLESALKQLKGVL